MAHAADDAGLKIVSAKAYLKSAIALANAVWDSPERITPHPQSTSC